MKDEIKIPEKYPKQLMKCNMQVIHRNFQEYIKTFGLENETKKRKNY